MNFESNAGESFLSVWTTSTIKSFVDHQSSISASLTRTCLPVFGSAAAGASVPWTHIPSVPLYEIHFLQERKCIIQSQLSSFVSIASVIKWAKSTVRRAPSAPLRFPKTGFEIIPPFQPLEEEHLEQFSAGAFCPVNIGDVFESKYQVLGKLGFGSTSTVWLARNLQEHVHVALKIYIRGHIGDDEYGICNQIRRGNARHPGYHHLRTAREMFVIHSPRGNHHCLVQDPMWDSWRDLFRRNPVGRFNLLMLKGGLRQILSALDYLHTECKLIHTDIKADNILHTIVDKSIIDAFVEDEMKSPSARKFVKGVPIYRSRRFGIPNDLGLVIMSDFGAAVRGDLKRNHDAQPDVYRSPEVMLEVPWSYPIDIWNIGVMVWDIFEGKHMFYGDDPEGLGYTTRAHLAEVVGMLGLPPPDLIERGERSKEFFTNGKWTAKVPVPNNISLENSEENFEGEEKREFLRFMRGMLQWRPEDRKTAKELLDDPWLQSSA